MLSLILLGETTHQDDYNDGRFPIKEQPDHAADVVTKIHRLG